MKIILYTTLFDGYDNFPKYHLPYGIDFDIITDLDPKISNYGPFELTKYYKMFPHLFFQDYDLSVWVDANQKLMQPEKLLELCKQLEQSDKTAIFFKHAKRNNIYEESLVCIDQKRATYKILDHYVKYRDDGFPDNIGLMDCGTIIRKHNDPDLIAFEELWWRCYIAGCKRDQVCCPYAMWKTKYSENIMLLENKIRNGMFPRSRHKIRKLVENGN